MEWVTWLDSLQFTPAPLPPTIVQYPLDSTVPMGAPANLCVRSEGPEPMFYQWYQAGQGVAGATSPCRVIPNAQLSHAGPHWVVISNAYGAITSAPVQVRVVPGSQFLTNTLTVAETITIPRYSEAAPYPSTLQVTGLVGRIQKLTVTLSNLSHPTPRDLWVLLVSPAGPRTILMRSVGLSYPPLELATLTFDDAAPADLAATEEQICSGTYRPTDTYPFEDLPAPAPAQPYSTNLLAFVGTDPNGLWQLFVYDQDDGMDRGAESKGASQLDGWSLQISTRLPALAHLTLQNGVLCFQFPTEAGRQYTVELKDSLGASPWQTLQTYSGNGAMQSFTNACPSSATRFYRLKIQ